MCQLHKLIVSLWILWFSSSYAHQQEERQSKLNIAIYYETLCPASAHMISKQVKSTWEQLKGFVEFELVPYGFAQHKKHENGKWTFNCQHGPDECLGNKIQSCGQCFLKQDPDQYIQFDVCMMTQNKKPFNLTCYPNEKTEKLFHECIHSKQGDELLAENGDKTHSVQPPFNGMPGVVFNGRHDLTWENEARNDLTKTACKLLNLLLKIKPAACSKI